MHRNDLSGMPRHQSHFRIVAIPALWIWLPLSAQSGSDAAVTRIGVDQQRAMTRHAEVQACIHHRTGTSPASARALSWAELRYLCAQRDAAPASQC